MQLWSNSCMKDYEQIISTLLTKIAELEKVVQQQAAKIAELEKRLNKNSSNSSKPPSSDGLNKPPRTTSLRETGKHNSGGQKGHKGETLNQIASPDVVNKHVLLTCPDCRCSFWILSGTIYTDRYAKDRATAGRSLASLGMTWGVTFLLNWTTFILFPEI